MKPQLEHSMLVLLIRMMIRMMIHIRCRNPC